MNVVEKNAGQLSALAERHGVVRLELFGSAAKGDFDPAHSDLDFLVTFKVQPPGGMADAYFGLLEDLEALFGRPVDLVTTRSIRNPYFRESVEASRRPLYVA